jgi:predicted TIM-barrel fold metal-dependent hydrolase
MRTIAIEEHYIDADIKNAVSRRNPTFMKGLAGVGIMADRLPKLEQLGEVRLQEMDAAGIDVQVLSHTTPATEVLPSSEAVPLAREANDRLATVIAAHPDRFAGFATLPTPDPEAAADELERAVRFLGLKGAMINGHVAGQFLDDPHFLPIFERAASLGVPLYLHPTEPPLAVKEAYYAGLAPALSHTLATSGWGWHTEAGLHALRIILAGVFDRFPGLQMILGHLGELIPFYLGRIDYALSPSATHLQRRVADYVLQNFSVTTSGLFTSPPLRLSLEIMGVDRVLFAVDYPYSLNTEGRAFLDQAPLSFAEKKKISSENAEKLLKLSVC